LTTQAHREVPKQHRGARRVLVVDDHSGFRRCARSLLVSEGFEVLGEAADGASAVALAAELEPDLVVLDVQLPDVDGFEVASRMLARDPDLAIVLVSSRSRSEYGPLIERCGARGFVSKEELSGAAIEELIE
jgi:DNA-binding NarL/FixJ family response regulator